MSALQAEANSAATGDIPDNQVFITFRNPAFMDDDVAGHVLGDMENPQTGDVSLMSFDPHPHLPPHPYLEWFSDRQNHYRIELAAGAASIANATETTPQQARRNHPLQIS